MSEPTFIAGIGPPLEQLLDDYATRDEPTRTEKDALALIQEVFRLRQEVARLRHVESFHLSRAER